MPRHMSFMLTTQQFRDRTKTVTRRLGWWALKPGDLVMGVEKAQGLKKGEKVKPLGLIRVVSTRAESLNQIGMLDCIEEGFPQMSPDDFMEMFCDANKCEASTIVNRIEFEYVGETENPVALFGIIK